MVASTTSGVLVIHYLKPPNETILGGIGGDIFCVLIRLLKQESDLRRIILQMLALIFGSAALGAIIGATEGLVSALLGFLISGLFTLTFVIFFVGLPKVRNVIWQYISLLILGTDQTSETISFDCWKALLRDESTEPSDGRLLKVVLNDCRIKQVHKKFNIWSPLPQIILENIWDEKFLIQYVVLPSGEMALHAIKMTSKF